MGTTGFTRIFGTSDNVETGYKNIHSIPLLGLDRSEHTLEGYKGKNILFVTICPASALFLPQLEELATLAGHLKARNIQVVGLATNSFEGKGSTFDQLSTLNLPFPVFPSVELNGPYTHPLIKYLKRRSSLYDQKLLRGNKIRQETGKFLVQDLPPSLASPFKQEGVDYYGSEVSLTAILQGFDQRMLQRAQENAAPPAAK